MLRLIQRFRRWRERRRNAARFIFEFWDGRRRRAVDPVVVWRTIHDDEELVIPADLEAADAGDIEAQAKAVRAARRAFDVTGWTEDQPGLTEGECLQLLVDFNDFCESLKKNTNAMPTSQQHSELEDLEKSTTLPDSG